MNWATYLQSLGFIILGGWLYSCGGVHGSLLAPVENALRRASEFVRQRKESKTEKDITPTIRP